MKYNQSTKTGEGKSPRVEQLEKDVAYWEKHHNALQRVNNDQTRQIWDILKRAETAEAQRDKLLAALRGILTKHLGRDFEKAKDWANAMRKHKAADQSLVTAVDTIVKIETQNT